MTSNNKWCKLKKHNDKFYIVSGKEFFINMEKAFISCLFILQRKGAILNRLKQGTSPPNNANTKEGSWNKSICCFCLIVLKLQVHLPSVWSKKFTSYNLLKGKDWELKSQAVLQAWVGSTSIRHVLVMTMLQRQF